MKRNFRLIKNSHYDDLMIDEELKEFTILLKCFFLDKMKPTKIVDISCFYGKTVEQLVDLVNGIGR